MSRQKGLWDNIHAKRKRIQRQKSQGRTPERMRSPGDPGAPTAEALRRSQRRRGPQGATYE